MKRAFSGIFGAIGLAAFAACASSGEREMTHDAAAIAAEVSYSGQVIYLERIALPPGAEVTVQLQDVSLADAPATTLAAQVIDGAAGPPYGFALTAPRAAVEAAHRLALRASIRAEGQLWFTTDTHIEAPKTGATDLQIRVVRVAAPQ